MFGHAVSQTIEDLGALASRLDFVLVLGFKDSGPKHWQS